jgi:hypothetical protein
MPYGGWSVYAKVTTTTTTTTQALCTNSNGGETDPYGDGCDAYLSSWCGGYDDTDFSSNAMCCICGGGNWLYSTTQAKEIRFCYAYRTDSHYATAAEDCNTCLGIIE